MAKLNKNRIKLGDIVFVNMNNVLDDDFVGKVMGTHGGIQPTQVRVVKPNNIGCSVYINRCSHVNETQRKEYFLGVLRGR